MVTAITEITRESDPDQCVALRDVAWNGYSALLRLTGDRSAPRIVYLDGAVWLMSPAFAQKKLKQRLGWLVEVIGEELDIPFIAATSTTLRRRRKRGAVEGDQTYDLGNEWVTRPQTDCDTKWIKAFRQWVKDTLVRRAFATGTNPADARSQQSGSGDRTES